MSDPLSHLESESLKSSTPFDVVAFGEVLWDIFPDSMQLGGAPLNFAWHVADMGLDSLLLSGIGNDQNGIDVEECLKSVNMGYSLSLSGLPTGVVNVHLDTEGRPSFDIVEDSAWDNIVISDKALKAIAKAQVFYFGSLSQRDERSAESLKQALRVFEDAWGRYRFFDINLRPPHSSPKALRWGLSHCDILKFSAEEMSSFAKSVLGSRTESEDIVVNACFERWPIQTIVQTRGALGATAWTRNGQHATCKGFDVKVVDTVGAGDAFSAAFLVSLIHDVPLASALEFGNRRAASVCQRAGALLL